MNSRESQQAGNSTYAREQFELGQKYRQLGTGDRGANLERSIHHYSEALRFFTPEAAPLDYARTQNNRGVAFLELQAGDRTANLTRAIECFTEALRFRTAEAAPLQYALTQSNLGEAYRELSAGDRANLTRAIDCYNQALRFFTAEAAPLDYAQVQNNLGSAYCWLQAGDQAVNLSRAIECFTEALRFRTAEAAPLQYARTQNNRGVAYLALRSGDRAANLTRAMGCYTEALRFFTPEAAPLDYAQVQNNLGEVYREMPAGDRGASLARAINCYTEALRFRTPEATPTLYASTQNNLGLAWAALPTGDKAANLARAIDSFTEALRFWTSEFRPLYYATARNNLGLAWAALPTGDKAANLARAIDCFTEALRFWTAETSPFNHATAHNNLGAAYRDLPAGDRDANLARAIDCYTEALRFRTAEAAPLNYAATQNNLGIAQADLRSGDRAVNLARAIDSYTEALRFFTAEASPSQYAVTKMNLGKAYCQLPVDDRAVNVAHAVDCFVEALRFATPDVAPANCRLTAHGLGNVYFALGRWVEAHAAYSEAIRAGELLYQATGSDAGRQFELGAVADIVAADAYCLARLGRFAEAVQCLEAGRTRALGDALARDRAALQETSLQDRAAFVAAADRIKTLESEGRAGRDAETPAALGMRSFVEHSAELVRARENLAVVIGRIRAYLPEFMAEGLSYPEIVAAASPERPLTYLLTTSRGSVALIVPADSQSPAPKHTLWLDGLTDEQVAEILGQQDPPGNNPGYLSSQLSGDLDKFAATVKEAMPLLRHELLAPLAARLADLSVSAATVVAVGRLSLLPLSAAAPDGCIIALAPSARALRAASRALRERSALDPVLLAVGNPLPGPENSSPLHYARLEVQAIEHFFAAGSRRVLTGETATNPAVASGLPGSTHLHLACHGRFDLREPLDSAIDLAKGGQLTLRGLLDGNMDLASQQLAVLSACQTGVAEFRRVPDEVIGLPAGFLQAGVPGVVATLWPVNDRSTAVLMAELYRLLLVERQNPATALAGARNFLRDATVRDLAEWFERCFDDSGESDVTARKAAAMFRSLGTPDHRPYANPVYWAGFVYTGP